MDAVSGELVSAGNSLVSGNFAGKCSCRVPRTAADKPENPKSLIKTRCSAQGILMGGSGKNFAIAAILCWRKSACLTIAPSAR